MSVSDDLFLAILAMDSYSRGSNPHLVGLGSQVGAATLHMQAENTSVGFSAQSYDWGGQKVISYRGTDDIPLDVLTGWITGAGVIGSQAAFAAQFYQMVAGKSIWDGPASNVILTGHSLGGGLAGLVASLTGDRATVFDSMPYAGAATLLALFKNIELGITDPTVLFGSNPPTPLFPLPTTTQITSEYLSGEALIAVRAAGAAVAGAFAGLLFGPAGPLAASFVTAYATLIESLQNNKPGLPSPGAGIDPFGLHGQAQLVISKWAQENGHTAWAGAGQEFYKALMGSEAVRIAEVLGLEGTVKATPSAQLAEMIAYSALYNPGASNWSLVFGDTALRALFDDTDALGALLSDPNVSKTIKDSAQALANVAAQFAGHLAKDKVVGASTTVPVADGVLSLSSNHQTLSIDFSDVLWTAGTESTSGPVEIIGRSDLTKQVFAQSSGGPAGQPFGSDVSAGMKWLWGASDASIIDRIVFATTNDALETTLTDRGYFTTKVSIFAAGGSDDNVTGSRDNDFIYGGDGKDVIRGGDGNDLLVGGEGDDRLSGGEGKDYLAGGAGKDTVFYEADGGGVDLTIKGVADEASGNVPTLELSKSNGNAAGFASTNNIDRVKDVEVIELTDQKDTVHVGTGLETLHGTILIDAKGQAAGERDVVDFSGSSTGISLKSTSNGAFYTSRGSGLFGDFQDLFSGRVEYKHFEKVVLTSQNDTVDIRDSADTRLMTIDLGDGNDTLYNAGQGSVIITGGGHDDIRFAHNIGIADLSADDRLTIGGIIEFHGGTRYIYSESEWATSYGGLFKTGINRDGELVVKAAGLGTIYVLNWGASGGMSTPFEQRPGHISVYEYDWGVYKLVNGNWPSHLSLKGTWDLFGAIVKANFGVSIWGGIDPIVLDLDGDGLELMQRSTVSPRFDIDGDLYAERTAWVRPDDGFLVRDINGNGKIDDVTEMFGGRTSGFAVLATLDGNQDGKVDANDNGLVDFNGDGVINDGLTDHDGDGVPDPADTIASLKIWRDLDEDAVTDAGELFSLADLGIASLSVVATAQQNMVVNGNQITETGTFTRTDGSTGTMGDVLLNIDNSSTRYTGGPITITEDAAEQPDLKGFGTLVSLREAMSLQEGLVATVSNTMAQMSSLSLNDLRATVLPILTGWAMASPLGDGDRNPNTSAPKLGSHDDVPVLLAAGQDGKQEVVDFAYRTSKTVTDVEGNQHVYHYWALASGGVILDLNGNGVDYPTLEQLYASPHAGGSWSLFDGDLIGFAERYLGEELPIDKVIPEGQHLGTESLGLFNNILSIVDLTVARLVVQAGPLSSFFSGITYDADGNGFTAAPGNERDLIPVFEAIFGAAVQGNHDAPWLAEWKPLLDIVIGDYSRGESYLLNTYGFIAENIVAAYENTGMTLVFTDVTTAFGIPSDIVVSGSGILTGSNDADIIYAGSSSNDVLRGGVGPDTYIFGHNIGHDIVDDVELASEAQRPDTIRFAHLFADDVTATRVGIDLILTVTATGETITVIGQFTGHQPGLFGGNLLEDRGVGEIIFADGVVWDSLDIARAVSHAAATSDTLNGTRAIDFLDGGAGDDVLMGGDEGDHYSFDVGYGHDRVEDNMGDILIDTPDFVEFGPGITKDNVIFKHVGDTNDLRVTIAGNQTDELTITDQFSAAYTWVFGTQWFDKIEIFAFSDGTYYTWVDLLEMVIANEQTEGDDTVYGFSYSDTLDGGAGNDYLSGHNESDTYIFGRGYGHDTVYDQMGSILASDTDVVVFKDVAYSDVTFQRIGNSEDFSILVNGTSDVLTVQGHFRILYGLINVATDRIEQFKFSDGTILSWEDIIHNFNATAGTEGNDAIYGFNYADTLTGGHGDDVLQGGREDDTYIYTRGDGNDTIIEVADAQTSAFDTLVLHGIAPSSVSLVRDGNDITLVIAESAPGAGDGGSVKLKNEGDDFFSEGVERITFDDGAVWTQNDLRLMLLAQASTSGNDTITGFDTNDTFRGGAGNDAINGMAGDDTYIYAHGDGNDVITDDSGVDTLMLEGINPSGVSLVRNGNDLTLVIAESAPGAGDGGSVLLKEELDDWFGRGIENVQFADGTIWHRNDLRLMVLAQASTAGNDTITGFNVSDTLRGGLGDDSISGWAGGDTYIYARGDGSDVITEQASSGVDTLLLEGLNPSAVSLARDGNDVRVIIAESAPGAGDGGSILLKDSVNDWFGQGIEQIQFADGTIWSRADIRTMLISAAGTPGDDVINGSSSSDIIAGGHGNDTINGNGGADIYIYNRGDGNDIIADNATDNVVDTLTLTGISPSQVSLVRNGVDVTLVIAESAPGAGDGGSILLKEQLDWFYQRGIEQIAFEDGTVWSADDLRVMLLAQASTSGNDTINGFNTADVLQGGAGNDTLDAGGGDDTYVYARGDGNDVITERNGNLDKLVLHGIAPGDVSLVRNGNHVTLVIAESAAGAGDGGSIELKEELEWNYDRGIEQIVFDNGTTWTPTDLRVMLLAQASTSGNDTIIGFNTADVLQGGTGNDTLQGWGGDDTYIYARGDGNDVITENNGNLDKLVLHGIAPGDVSLVRNGSHVTLVIAETAAGAGDGGSIELKEELEWNYDRGIEQVVFDNGTIWTPTDLRVMVLAQASTSGNDTIIGFNTADVLQGGAGNDTLNAGSGDDTYIYTRGDGNDVITENNGNLDKLVLHGIAPGDVSLVRNGSHVTLVIAESAAGAGDGGSIELKEELEWNYDRGIEQVVFDSGMIWTPTDLRAMVLAQASTSGNDTIIGFNTADVLQGGTGNDTLIGNAGNDTYIYTRGDGTDIINDQSSSGVNSLDLHGIAPSELTVVRNGNDAIVLIGSNGADGRITIRGQFNGAGSMSSIRFDDNTVWTAQMVLALAVANDGSVLTHAGTGGVDTIIGSSDIDVIDGGAANDILRGEGGSDFYRWGAGSGNDTILENGGGSDTDTVRLMGINPAEVSLGRLGNDLYITLTATGEVLKVQGHFNATTSGIEQIRFADNIIWDRAQIAATAWFVGTGAGETIDGSSSGDTIDGRGGNDTLIGHGGNDTYLFGVGSGNDTVVEGVAASDGNGDIVKLVGLNLADIQIGRSGNDLVLKILSSNESLRIQNQFSGDNGVETFTFADGSSLTRSQIQAMAAIFGTSANENISGTSGADTIDGGGGNDYITGGGGGDTYLYGAGSGTDTIAESSSDTGMDIVRLLALNPSDVTFIHVNNSNHLQIQINSTGEILGVLDQFNGTSGIEQVLFADGTTWDRSQIQAAAWYRGTASGENIYGSTSADTLDGKGGNDYLEGRGGGDTYIYAAGSGTDTINEVAANEGTDTVKLVGLNPSDVTFIHVNNSNHLQIQINSTGEILGVTDQFNGTNGIEQVLFADGSIWDRSQIQAAAWYRGTASGENIYGSASADTLDGKGGNDYLEGRGGGDTYIYAAGSGNDSIGEGATDGSTDTVKLVGLNPSDVTFIHVSNSNHLQIKINSTGEILGVTDQFNGTNGIEQVLFADGSIWDRSQIQAAAWYRGTSGNDSIQGSAAYDTLTGNQGNDYLRGNGGSDTYVYASGHGNDEIDDQSSSVIDIDTLKFANVNANDVTLTRSGEHLFVAINPTGETVKIDYQFYSQSQNWGIEQFQFANGDTWDLATINANAWYRGTNGNDSISSSFWNDTLMGNQGNDYLRGNGGSDTYVYASGHGNDEIDDQSSSVADIDTIKFANVNANDVTLTRTGEHLMVAINPTGETIKIDYQFYSQTGNWGVEKFQFANGDTWDLATINANAAIRGTSGNDTITGTAWNDTIAGAAGNDTMSGGAGNDTFVFRTNLGQDVVTDFTVGSDLLEFRDGNFADAAAALAAATASGSDTLITIDANNTVLLKNVSLVNLHETDFHIV